MAAKGRSVGITVLLFLCSILVISVSNYAKKDELPSAKNTAVIIIISGSVLLIGAGGSLAYYRRKKLKGRNGKTIKLNVLGEDKLSFSFANLQNRGGRESQQDSFGVSNIEHTGYADEKGILAIVADGMGGLAHGKEISEKTVHYMLSGFENMSTEASVQQLLSLVHTLNSKIYNQYQMEGGTTLVAVYIIENSFYWISVGDSTIYLKRDRALYQLNKEHIHLNTLYLKVLEDKMSMQEAMTDKEKYALTEYIGKDVLTEIDFNIKPFRLQAGDKLMLCSDGISSYLAESEILEALEQDITACCSKLERTVLSKKYPYQDNFTGLVVACK